MTRKEHARRSGGHAHKMRMGTSPRNPYTLEELERAEKLLCSSY